MFFRESNKYGELKLDALIRFEELIASKLPTNYRDYLIEHNGGKPCPSDFIISSGGDSSSIHHMKGIHNGPSYFSLIDSYLMYKGRMPSVLIPICDDPFGNLICISLKGKYRDKIFYWGHESEVEEGKQPYWGNIVEIYNDFNSFLDNLFENIDPNETIIERIYRTRDSESLIKLLDEGLDIESEDEFGRTLIENAAISAINSFIEILFARGAKLRHSYNYAVRNAEFFEEHKETVNLIQRLEQ
ncbi:SMI1/KNR4 family protein [Paenibacillus sp.]|uniref:SMI1/KNR4 family protein n=1 Tax=Paenibacillus sp. TaxID=58172 RepID=UPI002811BDE6|nr:SMI1/KNR4 family protein [Paenibacillus sp.]